MCEAMVTHMQTADKELVAEEAAELAELEAELHSAKQRIDQDMLQAQKHAAAAAEMALEELTDSSKQLSIEAQSILEQVTTVRPFALSFCWPGKRGATKADARSGS